MKKKYITLALSLFSLVGMAGCANPNPGNGGSTHDDVKPCPTYNEDSVQLHYYRKDRKFDKWALWLWDFPSGEGKEYDFNGIDDYGAVASYPLSTWKGFSGKLGFIVKSKGSWSQKDPNLDRHLDTKNFEKDENNVYHVYLKSGDKEIYTTPDWTIADAITEARFSSANQMVCQTNNEIESYKVYENNVVIGEKILETPTKGFRFTFPSDKKPGFDKSYKVSVTFSKTKKVLEANVQARGLYYTSDFARDYTYNGDDLGVTYTKTSSTFKVWSPVSSEIKLRIYDKGHPNNLSTSKDGQDKPTKEIQMTKAEKGIFEATIQEDLAGKYYTYVVTNGQYKEKEVVDPYAKSCGINGVRGMIVDFDKTNPEGWENIEPHPYDRKELTVYETHLQDITSSTTWSKEMKDRNDRYKFSGAAKEGTTYTENGVTVKTGFDHIKELGVNAVQFVPIFDQANDERYRDFNWGYNPLNYNCLEGAYSSNPYDGYARIKEFKQLVKNYNDAGINVIMDVVYNHVSSALGSNFDVLMPGYYFRYDNAGGLSNGSGCGNETASDLPMMRKFMIDSTKFWAKEYKLGGYRFDLMALHDIETMNKLVTEVKKINPNMCVYGEPWTGGASALPESKQAKQDNGNKFKGFGQFNDQLRDALIKGGLNGVSAKGWITETKKVNVEDSEKIQGGLKGITSCGNSIQDPDKTTNYVTCHDNYTLYDRIKKAGINDEATIKKMAMLANSIVFTSQGTTFMLAGEEFLRTKKGDGNSYSSSYEVNELNYALKIKHQDMFKNYQKLINLKQTCDGLHLKAPENMQLDYDVNADLNQFIIRVKDTKNKKLYQIVHCNGFKGEGYMPVNFEGYELYLDTINSSKALTKETSFEEFETCIGVKNL